MTMIQRKWFGFCSGEWTAGSLWRAFGLCSLMAIPAAEAQQVIMPPPAYSVTPSGLPPFQIEGQEVLAPVGTFPNAPQEKPLFQWGPVSVRPHPLYRFLYGDGIQASPGQNSKTAINEFSPGVLLGLGNHWTLDYTPTITLYSSSQFSDTTSHNVLLNGGTTYGDWVLGLSQNYYHSAEPLVETGGQTTQDEYLTAVTANYQMGRQTSLELAVNQDFTIPENFTETREWSTLDWLNYQFLPGFSGAIGAGFGYVDVSAGDDSIDGQLQGRITWMATHKIRLQVSGGVDDRHFFGGGKSDLINPIYAVSVQYQPTEATTISLSASDVVASSYYTNQVTETMGVNVTLNQRLLKKLFLTLTGGYQNVNYTATTSSVAADRNDDNYSLGARLSTVFLKRGTIAVFYQYSDNNSNEPGYSYTSNQGGIEVGYRY